MFKNVITGEITSKLVLSMKNGLNEVINAKVYHTRYLYQINYVHSFKLYIPIKFFEFVL